MTPLACPVCGKDLVRGEVKRDELGPGVPAEAWFCASGVGESDVGAISHYRRVVPVVERRTEDRAGMCDRRGGPVAV